ncbi:MAG: hypothetical protein EP329_16420 [Deltaproteobacteria bacterium]|nr:MAG: hypothetical protein EP329_16420 [Deltaproteobacteria bacterium]
MGVVGVLKQGLKGALDRVTGHAAVVDVTWWGRAAPGEEASARITVTSTGGTVKADAAVVDLHGEDDLDEGILDRAAELLPGRADPEYTFQIVGPFELAPDQCKTFEGTFRFPDDLEPGRTWLIRARVVMAGHDPRSAFAIFR